ncbi:MAG: type II toxin-antitoxin system HicA family toxin [Pseudanabaena sp. CRU_2_10]|nr:type II toxin-antitoxin system HicA family toxin [Pseudanabaena sp. CRU_2_10]
MLLMKAGFTYRPGKGIHTVWSQILLPDEPITIAGKDGDDAKLYLEKQIKQRLKKLED